MRYAMSFLFGLAILGLSGLAPADAQISAQCNLYPQSPGCPNYIPGHGFERNPRIGPTYPHEAPRYRYREYQGEYYGGPRYRQSAPARGNCRGSPYSCSQLQYYCSLGSQTPHSIRRYC